MGDDLEVIARLKVRPGQLTAFKAQVAEILRLAQEQDTRTLRYDWFINDDETECEVHEAYVDEDGLIEHNAHVMEARNKLFQEYAFDHQMCVYGPISPQMQNLFNKHAGGVGQFTLVTGLRPGPDAGSG